MLRKVHVNTSGMKTFFFFWKNFLFQEQVQVLMTVLHFNVMLSAFYFGYSLSNPTLLFIFFSQMKVIQKLRFMEGCYCHQAAPADDLVLQSGFWWFCSSITCPSASTLVQNSSINQRHPAQVGSSTIISPCAGTHVLGSNLSHVCQFVLNKTFQSMFFFF